MYDSYPNLETPGMLEMVDAVNVRVLRVIKVKVVSVYKTISMERT